MFDIPDGAYPAAALRLGRVMVCRTTEDLREAAKQGLLTEANYARRVDSGEIIEAAAEDDEPMTREDLKAFFDQEDIAFKGNASTSSLQVLYDEIQHSKEESDGDPSS